MTHNPKLIIYSKDAAISGIISAELSFAKGYSSIPQIEVQTFDRPNTKDTPKSNCATLLELDMFSEKELSDILSEVPSGPMFAIGKKRETEYACLSNVPSESIRFFHRPFRLDELANAVISALYTKKEESSVRQEKRSTVKLSYSDTARRFYAGSAQLELSSTERDVLLTLYKARGRAVTREELLNSVWGERNTEHPSNITDVYIRYLRKKLAQHFEVPMIISVRNSGYMLRAENS